MKQYLFNIKKKAWQVKTAETNSEELIMDGEPCMAKLYKQSRQIFIDESLLDDWDELRETIVHELTHAFLYTYAISPRQFRDEEFICEFNAVYGQEIQELGDTITYNLANEEARKNASTQG